MSKSALLKSSIAKKYWMALTGLFLCTFLIGHLIGNLQLILKVGEEGRRAFNEYAYFMQHNIFIKVLSYLTYISILFHAIDGLWLAVQNKKARPVKYAYNRPGTNSSGASCNMAVLGTLILVFIVMHMVNFWAKMHFSHIPLHTLNKTVDVTVGYDEMGQEVNQKVDFEYVLATSGEYLELNAINPETGKKEPLREVKDGTMLYNTDGKGEITSNGLKVGEGYKDLHSVVMAFFGQKKAGFPTNSLALWATIFYTISMVVLAFHLWHGFAAAFQSLGLRHKRYTPAIAFVGKAFAIIVPLLFAIIPVLIYLQIEL